MYECKSTFEYIYKHAEIIGYTLTWAVCSLDYHRWRRRSPALHPGLSSSDSSDGQTGDVCWQEMEFPSFCADSPSIHPNTYRSLHVMHPFFNKARHKSDSVTQCMKRSNFALCFSFLTLRKAEKAVHNIFRNALNIPLNSSGSVFTARLLYSQPNLICFS